LPAAATMRAPRRPRIGGVLRSLPRRIDEYIMANALLRYLTPESKTRFADGFAFDIDYLDYH
jgi:hypothetical protein